MRVLDSTAIESRRGDIGESSIGIDEERWLEEPVRGEPSDAATSAPEALLGVVQQDKAS